MHNFKKALINTTSLLLSFAAIFLVVIFPCFDPDSQYNDSATRDALSGRMDYIFSGASFTFQAVDTSIIDEELGVCSYNLASPAASWTGRYTLLKKEIERNELDTVVIDVSFDGLMRRASIDKATGEPTIFIKLGDLGESTKYLFDNISFLNNAVENVISVFMRYGLKAWKDKITGNTGILQKNKGFWPEPTNDVSLKEKKIIETSTNNLINFLSKWISNFLTSFIQGITELPIIGVYIVITILSTYFICADKFYILDQVELKFQISKLYEQLDKILTKREKEIVLLRYGLTTCGYKTQREIAERLKISRSYVSRIEKRALKKLQKEFKSEKSLI